MPPPTRLRVDPSWTPARLSGAILAAALPWVAPGSALIVVDGLAGMLLPVVIGRLVDDVVTPAASGIGWDAVAGPLAGWLGVVAGLYLVMNLSHRFGGRLGWYGVQRTQFELAQATVGRILDERGLDGPARPPGALLSVATADVHRACLVLYAAVYPPGQVVALLGAAVVLLLIHPGLGVGVIVGLPVVLAAMHAAAVPLRRRSLREQEGLADAAAAAADLVAGHRMIRGLHAETVAAGRYRAVSRAALRGTLSARDARAGFEGLSTLVARLFAGAVVLASAWLATRGGLSAGQLVTVAGVAVSLVAPLESLVGTLGTFWAVSQASAGRVLALLRTPPHPAALGDATADGPAAVRVDGLGLPGGGTLDAVWPAGAFVVVDLDQADQAHLVDVLGARACPQRGEVRVAGLAVSAWRPDALRRRVLVVPHTPALVAGTLRDNVLGADAPVGTAAAQALSHALAVAGIAAGELPAGGDTRVSDGGQELSGGQRQRIALARAVAADPDVLVLVEPTSSVDSVTEARIARALRDARAGRTTVVCTAAGAFRAVADHLTGRPDPGEGR